jgi:hypothetical protein
MLLRMERSHLDSKRFYSSETFLKGSARPQGAIVFV